MMNTDDQRDLTGRRGQCSPWPIVPGSLFQRFLKGVAQRVRTDHERPTEFGHSVVVLSR